MNVNSRRSQSTVGQVGKCSCVSIVPPFSLPLADLHLSWLKLQQLVEPKLGLGHCLDVIAEGLVCHV